MSYNNPDVFDGGYQCEGDPGYDQTSTPQVSSSDENHRAENPEESIKDRVFDERSYTDVLIFTLLSRGLVILGIFYNIQDGGDDCDDQLEDSNDDDGCGQVQPEHRLETWPAVHLGCVG